MSHSLPTPKSWQSIQNLLLMRLDNIGDVIMTSPAIRALRENLPHTRMTLMASLSGSQVAPFFPWIDEVISWRVLWQDLGRLDFNPNREWQLIETLKSYDFDAAIIFTSFSQSPHPSGFICALAGIPLRLGESKEKDFGTLTHAIPPVPDEIHQVERNLHLIESVGFKVSDRHLTLSITQQGIKQVLASLFPDSSSPSYILLNPWSSCSARNYDLERFAIAARQLNEITRLPIVVTGVEKDREHSFVLLEKLGSCAINLMGKTNLLELVVLVAQAKLLLTNNTSTVHIADATNTPSVILYSGTDLESQWQPRYSPTYLLRRPTDCSPCYAFICPYRMECLDISPKTVVNAGLKLLEWNTYT